MKSRWTSWAPVPNKSTVSVGVKQHFNHQRLKTLTRVVGLEPDDGVPPIGHRHRVLPGRLRQLPPQLTATVQCLHLLE